MPKNLFLELETSNFGSCHVFLSRWKWQGQILPNLIFWTQNWHFSGKIQKGGRLCQPHYYTCILPEICRFWVQNVKLGQIQPRHFNGLEKTKLEPKFEVTISKNKDLVQQCTFQKVWKIALSISVANWVISSKSIKINLGNQFLLPCFEPNCRSR